MKNVLLALLLSLSFLGCSDEVVTPVESKVVVGGSLESLQLNDQFEKPHTISADTKKVIFAFSKDMGHMSNEFFAKQGENYLVDHKAVFVADVSGAPSLVRSMFIMPGLKDFKHKVLVIEDKSVAAAYRKDAHKEEIMVLDVNNYIIEKINYVSTEDALAKAL
jgi:hypothetical protein